MEFLYKMILSLSSSSSFSPRHLHGGVPGEAGGVAAAGGGGGDLPGGGAEGTHGEAPRAAQDR